MAAALCCLTEEPEGVCLTSQLEQAGSPMCFEFQSLLNLSIYRLYQDLQSEIILNV